MKPHPFYHIFFPLFTFLFILNTSVWGACSGTNTGSWNTATSSSFAVNDYYVKNTTQDYYPVSLSTSGTLVINVKDDDSSSYDNLTATLYGDSSCGSALWTASTTSRYQTGTLTFNQTLVAGNYVLHIAGSSSDETKYDVSGTFTSGSITYVDSADDICYDDYVLSGMMCFEFGGFGCTTTFPIRNISNDNISNVQVIHNEDGMTGSMFSGCNVTPSGDCEEESNLDMGPFGMFGSATSFSFDNAITPTQTDASVSTTSMMSMSFFTTESLYATYQKDGVYYRGVMKPCPEVSNGGRDFELRNPVETRNIKGNLKVIGNTVLCYKENGVCVDTDLANNRVSLSFIDIDGVNRTYNNSSQAQVADVPSTAKVVWAGFYTQGFLKTTQNATVTALNGSPTYLTIPSGATIELRNDVIDVYPFATNEYTYATFTEVDALKGLSGSQVNGWFTGANIKALTGDDDGALGYFGAWTLVIVYEDASETLKNISVFDGYKQIGGSNDTIDVSGFYTPTSGTVNSALSVFVGEGDKNIEGDDITLEGTSLSSTGTTNAFNSTVNGFTTNPNPINYQGIDIHNYNVGKDGDTSHPQIIGNGVKEATIGLTTTGDYYYPSMVAFTTDLYEPRVCYKQEFLDANGNPLENISIGDTITVATWISNMKKDASDGNLEDAEKVEITVELDSTNLAYKPGTLKMKNIGESIYTARTDAQHDDTIEYFTDLNQSKWRVGDGANATDGGTLKANGAGEDTLKTYVQFQVELLKEGDITIDNIYKVSYENSALQMRIGDESPINIGVCTDINTSLGVNGLLGAFNVVNEFGGASDFDNPASAQTYLVTQVAGRPFNVKIISLNATGDALASYNGDVNVSLIPTPNYQSCFGDATCMQNLCNASSPIIGTSQIITFNNSSSEIINNFSYNSASQDLSFKIAYNSGANNACSLDSFAMRPDHFNILVPAGQDLELLRAGTDYTFPLRAVNNDNATATPGYTRAINTANFDLNQTLYLPDNTIEATLNGALAFGPLAMNFLNGISNNFVATFNEVAKVNMLLIDNTWAGVDINNSDTPADCSATGAFVCGDVNVTFIPNSFTFTVVPTLHNEANTNTTYLSNDLNMSAHLDIQIQATNANGVATQNFATNVWENPVSVTYQLPAVAGMVENKQEINAPINLDFAAGSLAIPWNEANTTKELQFNFNRTINTPLNPFVVQGADVNITVASSYTAATSGATATITGNANGINNNATFVYGRTHAPRQRYTDNVSQNAFIYFESFCSATDANGVTCNKALLPNGIASTFTDDPRWFVNLNHNSLTEGSVDIVKQKSGTNVATDIVDASDNPGGNPSISIIDYDASRGYPYKTTMENNASSWLIYNPNNAAATTNEFEVEFDASASSWAGQNESNSTTQQNASQNTHRRIIW